MNTYLFDYDSDSSSDSSSRASDSGSIITVLTPEELKMQQLQLQQSQQDEEEQLKNVCSLESYAYMPANVLTYYESPSDPWIRQPTTSTLAEHQQSNSSNHQPVLNGFASNSNQAKQPAAFQFGVESYKNSSVTPQWLTGSLRSLNTDNMYHRINTHRPNSGHRLNGKSRDRMTSSYSEDRVTSSSEIIASHGVSKAADDSLNGYHGYNNKQQQLVSYPFEITPEDTKDFRHRNLFPDDDNPIEMSNSLSTLSSYCPPVNQVSRSPTSSSEQQVEALASTDVAVIVDSLSPRSSNSGKTFFMETSAKRYTKLTIPPLDKTQFEQLARQARCLAQSRNNSNGINNDAEVISPKLDADWSEKETPSCHATANQTTVVLAQHQTSAPTAANRRPEYNIEPDIIQPNNLLTVSPPPVPPRHSKSPSPRSFVMIDTLASTASTTNESNTDVSMLDVTDVRTMLSPPTQRSARSTPTPTSQNSVHNGASASPDVNRRLSVATFALTPCDVIGQSRPTYRSSAVLSPGSHRQSHTRHSAMSSSLYLPDTASAMTSSLYLPDTSSAMTTSLYLPETSSSYFSSLQPPDSNKMPHFNGQIDSNDKAQETAPSSDELFNDKVQVSHKVELVMPTVTSSDEGQGQLYKDILDTIKQNASAKVNMNNLSLDNKLMVANSNGQVANGYQENICADEPGLGCDLNPGPRRRSSRKPLEFNMLIAGEHGTGKTTLLHTLLGSANKLTVTRLPTTTSTNEKVTEMTKVSVQCGDVGGRVKMTGIDTAGYGLTLSDYGYIQDISDYIDGQLISYLVNETATNRRVLADDRVHCCLYIFSPHSTAKLKPTDVSLLKRISHKVNIIPIIGRADSLTAGELAKAKENVRQQLERHGVHVYSPTSSDDLDIDKSYPFAVCGSDEADNRGRQYSWGRVEVTHCDLHLLQTFITRHMHHLVDVTHWTIYESFRGKLLLSVQGNESNILENGGEIHET